MKVLRRSTSKNQGSQKVAAGAKFYTPHLSCICEDSVASTPLAQRATPQIDPGPK
jgi:hypothetical protein